MPDYTKELHWIKILLALIAIPVVVLVLKTLKAIFIPLVFAIFLSFAFAPLTGYLRRKNVHIYVIMLTMILIILIFTLSTVLLMSLATNSLISGFPKYQERLAILFQDGTAWFEGISARTDLALNGLFEVDLSQMLDPGKFSITKAISDVMTTTMNIGWNFFLIVVFLLFLIAQGGLVQRRLKKSMDKQQVQQTSTTMTDIQKQIQKYLLTKTFISLSSTLVLIILMLLYGVDFVIICGMLLFVMNFIPNVGSIIANTVPLTICLLQGGFDVRFFTFMALVITNELLFSNVIEPKIQGNRMNLSPITVLVSLIFWGWIWGIVGMIMAVPITSAINIVLLQIDEKNLVSAIISGDKR